MMGQLPAAQKMPCFATFALNVTSLPITSLRQIDQFLDFDKIRQHLQPFYSTTGRPSIYPELMIRMLLVGYCYGICSERRLCEEINFNLACRWFYRLGLEAEVPDHSTFSKNRHGRSRESDLFRFILETVVNVVMEQGLVKGEGFTVDASLLKADVRRQRAVKSSEYVYLLINSHARCVSTCRPWMLKYLSLPRLVLMLITCALRCVI